MKEILKSKVGLFETDAAASIVSRRGDDALKSPASVLVTQRASLLGDAPIGSVKGQSFKYLEGQFFIQGIIVEGPVADVLFAQSGVVHEAKDFLNQTSFICCVDADHDDYSFSGLSSAETRTTAFGFGNSAIDIVLTEPVRLCSSTKHLLGRMRWSNQPAFTQRAICIGTSYGALT